MREKIKFIAAYQSRPISKITHIASVKSIEPYLNTNKCIVHFSTTAKKLKKPEKSLKYLSSGFGP